MGMGWRPREQWDETYAKVGCHGMYGEGVGERESVN
jgi:hypothetical protein